MFLQPKNVRYKKIKKGKLNKLDFRKNKLRFGTVGLKATSSAIVSARHIEASRQAISRKIKKKGKLWIRIFPDLPITSKSLAARMGKGKGPVSHWGARVSAGSIIFEICGIKDPKVITSALRTGGAKLPLKTKVVT